MVLAEFEINPILLWEVLLRQTYDKILKVDDGTIMYNIQLLKEYHLTKRNLIKIIHLTQFHLLLIMTDSEGEKEIMNMMTK